MHPQAKFLPDGFPIPLARTADGMAAELDLPGQIIDPGSVVVDAMAA